MNNGGLKVENKNKWEFLHKNSRFRPRYPSEIVVQYIFRNFERDGKTRILDLGCGAGRHVFFLGCENFIPYGLDISQSGVDYTKQLLKDNGMSIYSENVVCSPFEAIPFSDEFFDGIVAYGSLYYSKLDGIETAIKEMYRILKPGGKAFVFIRGVYDYRYGCGELIEENTFIIKCEDCQKAAFNENGMVMHFFYKDEIYKLFEKFSSVKIDEMRETYDNQKLVEFNYIVSVIK